MEEEACGALSECQMVNDSMLTIFLLFIFPSELSLWPFTSEAGSRVAPSLMDWQFVQKRFPWGVEVRSVELWSEEHSPRIMTHNLL